MKKIVSVWAFVMIAAAVQAQTEKGDWMVGGAFRLNTATNNTVINLSPSAAPFVINNLAIGANVNLGYSKTGDNKTTSFGIGPFVRYYFTSANVRPIIQGNLNFLSSRFKIADDAASTNNGLNYFLGGGAAIFLNDQVSIDGLLGYDHTKYKNDDGSGGFAMNIGFQVYLHRSQVEKLRGTR